MKSMKIKMTPRDGSSPVFWRVWREARVHNVGGRLEHPYTGPMWMVERHDGVTVGLEANWHNSADAVRRSADCYGFDTSIS